MTQEEKIVYLIMRGWRLRRHHPGPEPVFVMKYLLNHADELNWDSEPELLNLLPNYFYLSTDRAFEMEEKYGKPIL
jgi:hypothetical protein